MHVYICITKLKLNGECLRGFVQSFVQLLLQVLARVGFWVQCRSHQKSCQQNQEWNRDNLQIMEDIGYNYMYTVYL
jgi:hypothetical protein